MGENGKLPAKLQTTQSDMPGSVQGSVPTYKEQEA